MPAENGGHRPTWYARFTRNGQKVNVNLGVPIKGTIPTFTAANGKCRYNISSRGDEAFEQSRAAALSALSKMRRAAKTTGDAKEVKEAKDAVQAARYYRARTGVSVKGVRLKDLGELWAKQKRSYTPTENWKDAVQTWFARFAKFAAKHAAEHGKRCETVNEVTSEIASAWFDEIKSSFAWESVTKQMSLLRNAYARYALDKERNPFADVIMRNRETANARKPHKPLAGAELERLFDYAREDKNIYSLIVAAACTGMRIGDVCTLKWSDVDTQGGLIDCVTAKAGVRVSIPIIGRLRDVLAEQSALPADGSRPSAYVFPAAATLYKNNPTAIYREAKPFFARAIFGTTGNSKPADIDADGNLIPTPALEDVIGHARFTAGKRARVLEVYRRFKMGEQSNLIAAALDISRSQVSMDLREAEKLTGERLRPRATARSKRQSTIQLLELTREQRTVGRRAASIYGWHSLRATFVVLAIEAGVPLADIQRIVGHTTTDMTMEYFNPEKKHTAERVRRQMRDTVLATGKAAPLVEGTIIETPGDNAPAQLPAPAKSAAERLRELKSLADEGLITQAEYANCRKAIISSLL